jgi:hypothetical protein
MIHTDPLAQVRRDVARTALATERPTELQAGQRVDAALPRRGGRRVDAPALLPYPHAGNPPAPTRAGHRLMTDVLERIRVLGEPFKRSLIDRVLPTRSLLDAGGMWGVHGAYALHAATHGAERVVLLDTLRTAEFDAWRVELPGKVDFVEGDLNDPGTWLLVPEVETALCFEVLMHQPVPLLTLHGLTCVTTRRIVLSVSVIPEARFATPNCAVFLPGMPREHQDTFHPEPGNPVFKVYSTDPAAARSHSEWHWGLTATLITSWMKYLGWSVTEEWRRPVLGNWEWWQAIFQPDAGVRL